MAQDLLTRYGIKEVADITFYSIDNTGNKGNPILILDSLKTASIEQTAEMTEAKGGRGNPSLISWDFGKEINIPIEDALFSMKSFGLMFGDTDITTSTNGIVSMSQRKVAKTAATAVTEFPLVYIETSSGQTQVTASSVTWYDVNGEIITSCSAGDVVFATWNQPAHTAEITISPETFPGTYYVEGLAYARSERTGKDEYFQFIIPKAKMQAEQTITMEAEGDPTTFNMSLKVLRPDDGTNDMIKFIKYTIPTVQPVQPVIDSYSHIVWDGDTTGKTLGAQLDIGDGSVVSYYKVSDINYDFSIRPTSIITRGYYAGQGIEGWRTNPTYTDNYLVANDDTYYYDRYYIIRTPNTTVNDLTFSDTGIYFPLTIEDNVPSIYITDMFILDSNNAEYLIKDTDLYPYTTTITVNNSTLSRVTTQPLTISSGNYIYENFSGWIPVIADTSDSRIEVGTGYVAGFFNLSEGEYGVPFINVTQAGITYGGHTFPDTGFYSYYNSNGGVFGNYDFVIFTLDN